MAQAQDIINGALRHLGVLSQGETPSPDESNDSLTALNNLVNSWSIERLAIYAIARAAYNLVGGTSPYTIGTAGGANFNAARPVSIRAANVISATGGFYFALELITAEEFAAIPERTAQAKIPTKLYYDNDYPLGKLYLWPIPSDASQLELFTWEPITSFATLADTFDLPPGYQRAIEYNLALDLAPQFGKPLTPDLVNLASQAKTSLQQLNLPPTAGQAEEIAARAQVQNAATPQALKPAA